VSGTDSLYLVGANGSQEQIIIAANGSWQQEVLLGAGPNPFEISAKKFLGGTTSVTEQIFYQPAGGAAPSSTASGISTSTNAGVPNVATPSGTATF
jgi:hypothetical protein